MTTNNQDVCANCKWWREKKHPFTARPGEIGECRAVLPFTEQTPGIRHVPDAKWPTTENDDYCRYFEHRDDRAARLLGTNYMNRSEGEAA